MNYRDLLTPRNILWLGAVVVVIGSVLPWATVKAGMEGFEASATSYGLDADGIITLILAVVIGVIAFFFKPASPKYIGWIEAIIGAIVGVISLIDIADVNRVAGDVEGAGELGIEVTTRVDIGLIVVLVGAIICIVGGLIPWPGGAAQE